MKYLFNLFLLIFIISATSAFATDYSDNKGLYRCQVNKTKWWHFPPKNPINIDIEIKNYKAPLLGRNYFIVELPSFTNFEIKNDVRNSLKLKYSILNPLHRNSSRPRIEFVGKVRDLNNGLLTKVRLKFSRNKVLQSIYVTVIESKYIFDKSYRGYLCSLRKDF